MGCRCHTPGELAAVLMRLQSILALPLYSGITAQASQLSAVPHVWFISVFVMELRRSLCVGTSLGLGTGHIHSFVYSLIHFFIHPFIRSFIHAFIHAFINHLSLY